MPRLILTFALLAVFGCSNGLREIERAEDAAARAATLIDEARGLAPSNPQAANNRFRQAEQALITARTAYQRARADASTDPELLEAYADVVQQLSDFDLAGEAFARAAKLRGDDADLWFRAGRNFVDAGGSYLGAAAEPLNRALQLSADDDERMSEVRVAQGEVLWKQGQYLAAHDQFVRANDVESAPPRARLALIASTLAQGRISEAQDLIEEIESQELLASPFAVRMLRDAFLHVRETRIAAVEAPRDWVALAKLSVRLGFLEEGRLAAERAISLGVEDPVTMNLAGSLAAQAGDSARARELFSRSLELDPNQPRTREALRGLGQSSP